MRKLLSIFFLSLCIFSFSEFHQLMKIPVLFQHFAEHRKEDPKISLLAFLKLHYKGSFAVDEDYKRDQELPFRNSETHVNIITVCEFAYPQYDLKPHYPETRNKYNLSNDGIFPVSCIQDIFQPPRFS